MEFDIKLRHKQGKRMIVADALLWRSDYFVGIKDDNEHVTALPEDLWIRLLDTEIRDAVVLAQADDSMAQEVIKRLNDPAQSPDKWSVEADPNGTSVLFYDSRMYIPDDLTVCRRIVADHHDTTVAGHPGILATARSVSLSY